MTLINCKLITSLLINTNQSEETSMQFRNRSKDRTKYLDIEDEVNPSLVDVDAALAKHYHVPNTNAAITKLFAAIEQTAKGIGNEV